MILILLTGISDQPGRRLAYTTLHGNAKQPWNYAYSDVFDIVNIKDQIKFEKIFCNVIRV